jgi:drug/metabolite transporter (DMT)-like permease
MERGQRPRGVLPSLLGFALALAGIALFFRGVGIFRDGGSPLAGTALLIVGAICVVVANIWGRRLRARYSPERR